MLHRLHGHAQHAQGDTVAGGAIAGQRWRPISQHRLAHAERSVERLHMAAGRPVAIRGQHGHPAKITHRLGQRQQAGGGHTIIIGYQNMHRR